MSEAIEIDWGKSVLIPEGEYQAVYVSHATTHGTFGPKVKITFRIVTQGAHFETLIDAWYNVKGVGVRVGKRGRIKLSRHSKLTLELMQVLHLMRRVDRISPEQLKGHILLIKVRTVKQNSSQKSLPDVLHYSVVDSMVSSLNFQDISELPLVSPVPISEPIPTIKSSGVGPIRLSEVCMASN